MNVIVEVGGTFTTSNNTSIFNLNNKTLRLYKDFSNYNGNTTLIGLGSGAAGSLIEFAGNTPQTFTNLGSNLTLNNVTINQPIPGSTVTLTANATSNLILGTSGILTLTSGKFITGATNEVVVQNTATAGASTGNTNSYVNGWLRRSFATSATTYEFAVGDALMGYERATMQFTTAPTSPYSLAMRFLNWAGSISSIGGTAGTNTIQVSSIAGLAVGQILTGTGIAPGATVVSIAGAGSPYTITLSANNVGAVSGSLTIGNNNLPLVNGVYPPLECAKYDWSKKAALNHGYWNTSCSINNPTGTYNLTLYNRSQTNYTSSTSTSYPVSVGQVALGTTLNFTNTAGLLVGMNVSGTGIAPG